MGGDAEGAVQVHLFNPSLSGTPHCLLCSKFIQSISPGLAYCFPGSDFHISSLLFVRFLYFLHHELLGLFLLLPPPLYPAKALSTALSEGERLGLLSGGLSQAFKSCCTSFGMAMSLLFLRSPSSLLQVWMQS